MGDLIMRGPIGPCLPSLGRCEVGEAMERLMLDGEPVERLLALADVVYDQGGCSPTGLLNAVSQT